MLDHGKIVRERRDAAADRLVRAAALQSQHRLGFDRRVILVEFARFQVDDVLLAGGLLPEDGLHSRRFHLLHGPLHIRFRVEIVRHFANDFQRIARRAANADRAAAALLALSPRPERGIRVKSS